MIGSLFYVVCAEQRLNDSSEASSSAEWLDQLGESFIENTSGARRGGETRPSSCELVWGRECRAAPPRSAVFPAGLLRCLHSPRPRRELDSRRLDLSWVKNRFSADIFRVNLERFVRWCVFACKFPGRSSRCLAVRLGKVSLMRACQPQTRPSRLRYQGKEYF